MACRRYVKKIISDYEQACNELAVLFANKQGLSWNGWVADEVGSIGDFSGMYYFGMEEIILDLRSNQPKGLITDWHDDNVEHEQNFINYYSYTKGLRHKDVVDDEK